MIYYKSPFLFTHIHLVFFSLPFLCSRTSMKMDRVGLISLSATLLVLGTIFSLYPSAHATLRSLPLPRQLKDCYLRAQNYTAQHYVGGLYCWYCETPVRAYIKGSPQPMKAAQYA